MKIQARLAISTLVLLACVFFVLKFIGARDSEGVTRHSGSFDPATAERSGQDKSKPTNGRGVTKGVTGSIGPILVVDAIGCQVSGNLVDGYGRPGSAARVKADWGLIVNSSSISPPSRLVRTDADGDFVFADLQPGLWQITASLPTNPDLSASSLVKVRPDRESYVAMQLRGAAVVEFEDLVPPNFIHGRIVDGHASIPLYGIAVTAIAVDGSRSMTTKSLANGMFVLGPLEPGTTWSLRAAAPDLCCKDSDSVVTEPGHEPITLSVECVGENLEAVYADGSHCKDPLVFFAAPCEGGASRTGVLLNGRGCLVAARAGECIVYLYRDPDLFSSVSIESVDEPGPLRSVLGQSGMLRLASRAQEIVSVVVMQNERPVRELSSDKCGEPFAVPAGPVQLAVIRGSTTTLLDAFCPPGELIVVDLE